MRHLLPLLVQRAAVIPALLLLLLTAGPAAALDDHLLLCEAVLTPTTDEFIEIVNPTGSTIALDNYYLSDDDDYARVPGITGNGPTPVIDSTDFIVRFPAGTSIGPGEVIVVAFSGAGFFTTFGFEADYEILSTDETPDMLPLFVTATSGLTNAGESAVLFFWDGTSDLVDDVDMLNLGTPTTANDIANKTGVAVDGPDAGTLATTYANDAFTMPQQATDPGFGVSTKRIALEGLNESAGGNGLTGDDETTEQITITWDSTYTAPDPGVCAVGGAPAEPKVVVNEIDYDQPGTDGAEFIELKNSGTVTVDLDLYAVRLVNGNAGGAAVYNTIDLPAVSLAPGQYFVICGDAALVENCDLDVTPNTDLVQNGAPDAVALVLGSEILDTVSYEGDTAAPYTEGSGVGLEDPSTGGVGGPNERKGISRFPDGTDNEQNNADFAVSCISPGETNLASDSDCNAGPPQLVVNEIDYDQPGTDTAEFVEIKNNGASAVDLDLVTLELVNGNAGVAVVYQSVDLPSFSLAAGDYYVVCLTGSTVANCDLAVLSSIQNGSPDAVALRYEGEILDTVSYEGNTAAPYTEGSGTGLEDFAATGDDFKGISRFPDGADTDVNNVDFVFACVTPGAANTSSTTGCGATGQVLEIWEIQGEGTASPFAGQTVTTENNVVTAVGPNGFFLQTPVERTDADVDSSDGIFVFTSSAPAVAVGDLVNVTGQVVEFFDFTEFSNGPLVTVVTPGGGTVPPPVVFSATVPSPDPTMPSCAVELECYEGMLVTAAGFATGPTQSFGTDPIAEFHAKVGSERAFREPGILFPGLPDLPVWDGNPEVFEIDPDKLGLANAQVTAGTPFTATGGLGFEFSGYEIWATEYALGVAPELPRPVRARAAGEFTVGTLNVFRLFDDVNDPGDDEVVSAAEYALRLGKFSRYIREVLGAPEVLAIQEVEKLAVLQALADRIEADDPSLVYTPYLVEGNDVGGIDVGFLVRDNVSVDAVTQLGAAEIFPLDGSLLHDRPPLLLEGSYTGNGAPFPIVVMVVHNRSLGGIEDPVDGDRVRRKRLAQAQSIAEKVQDLQDLDPDVRLTVIGDFNAFQFTDGYVDAVGQIRGVFDPDDNLLSGPDLVDPDLDNQVLSLPPEEQYSFIFDGSAQVLDHALTSQGFDAWVRGFEYGRGNADAPGILVDDGTTVLRASDHDGAVLFVMSDFDGDGIPDDEECDGETVYGVDDTGLGSSQLFALDLASETVTYLGAPYADANLETLSLRASDGELFTVASLSGELYTVDKNTGELTLIGTIPTVKALNRIAATAFHPDGSLWGYQWNKGLVTIGTSDASRTLEWAQPTGLPLGRRWDALAWSLDGTVLYGAQEQELYRWDPLTRTALRLCGAGFLPEKTEGLDVDAAGNLVGSSNASLFVIDPVACTLTGLVDVAGAEDIEGIAFEAACE